MKQIWPIKMRLNKIYSEFCICRYLSDNFLIQNGLKQGDALLPLLLNLASEYTIRNVYVRLFFCGCTNVGLSSSAKLLRII
jgi:hypothetical protein